MHTLAEDRSLRKYSHLISPHLILPKIISGVYLQHLETSIATAFKSYLQESFKGLGLKSQKAESVKVGWRLSCEAFSADPKQPTHVPWEAVRLGFSIKLSSFCRELPCVASPSTA